MNLNHCVGGGRAVVVEHDAARTVGEGLHVREGVAQGQTVVLNAQLDNRASRQVLVGENKRGLSVSGNHAVKRGDHTMAAIGSDASNKAGSLRHVSQLANRGKAGLLRLTLLRLELTRELEMGMSQVNLLTATAGGLIASHYE